MPTYCYHCTECDEHFEAFHSMRSIETVCAVCGVCAVCVLVYGHVFASVNFRMNMKAIQICACVICSCCAVETKEVWWAAGVGWQVAGW